MATAKKVGLFGGTFNPIHLGHLRGGEEIRDLFGLDQVIFIPSAHPPHKAAEDVVDPLSRLEMVKLATSSNPFFSVSDVELQRSGESYSVDTLDYFRERGSDTFFFIVGTDAFLEIETWKEYRKLFSLCNFIVMTRPGSGDHAASTRLPKGLISMFHSEPGGGFWRHESGHTLRFSEIVFLDISSTRIRDLLKKGRSVKYLVPSEVEDYIERHGLYRRKKAAARPGSGV